MSSAVCQKCKQPHASNVECLCTNCEKRHKPTAPCRCKKCETSHAVYPYGRCRETRYFYLPKPDIQLEKSFNGLQDIRKAHYSNVENKLLKEDASLAMIKSTEILYVLGHGTAAVAPAVDDPPPHDNKLPTNGSKYAWYHGTRVKPSTWDKDWKYLSPRELALQIKGKGLPNDHVWLRLLLCYGIESRFVEEFSKEMHGLGYKSLKVWGYKSMTVLSQSKYILAAIDSNEDIIQSRKDEEWQAQGKRAIDNRRVYSGGILIPDFLVREGKEIMR